METLGAAGGATFRDGVEDAIRGGIERAGVAHRLGPCGGFLNGRAVREIVVAESASLGLGGALRKRGHDGERQNAKRDETMAHEALPHTRRAQKSSMHRLNTASSIPSCIMSESSSAKYQASFHLPSTTSIMAISETSTRRPVGGKP